MEKIRTLADQIRDELGKPAIKATEANPKASPPSVKKDSRIPAEKTVPDIIKALSDFDNSTNKLMVHVRFDKKTVDIMTKFKMATGTDMTKLVAFAVKHLMDTHPEIKSIIKQYILNTDL